MATTPTSMVNRLMGLETWTDPVTFAAGTTIGGIPQDPTGTLIAIPAATTTLTLTLPLHAGRILLIASTGGLAITPPAATGSGAMYRFIVTTTVSGGSFTIDAKAGNASDLFFGRLYQVLTGTGEIVYDAGTNANLITLNGSTTGGLKGDYVEMVDVATHMWYVFIDSRATGSVATCFSNH